MRRLRILTWHVHGNYLYSLSHLPHDFVIPVLADNRPGYCELGTKLPWGDNIRMVPAGRSVANHSISSYTNPGKHTKQIAGNC